MSSPSMLQGYRVLDITQIVAGPTCGRLLAEMGADVVKLELGPHGDRTRIGGLRPTAPEYKGTTHSTYYFQHNHSKRSLALDFKHPHARDLIRRLVPKFDVVIENFSPGVMARAGLSYGELKALHPGLIMCSISLAGQTGPLSQKPGYDYIAQAYSGVTDLIGDPNGEPALITMAIGDMTTGWAAAMAISFALLHRERTGEGQHVEASLLDSYMNMHEVAMPRVSLRKNYTPRRTGSQHPDGGPTGIFRCSDGSYITLATLPHQWKAFVEALEQPGLLDDPRFSTAALRRDNNTALKSVLEAWLARFPTRETAIERLEVKRIPVAPVLTLNEAMAHPHMRARGTVRRVHDQTLGAFDIPGMPVRFSGWTPSNDLHADLMGENNESTLVELLGLTDAEIAGLYAEGVLVRDPSIDKLSRRERDATHAMAE
ncbi:MULTISPECIES: CaiB/BaiF CoA transferase family protein [Cupriavidus]|uniref:CaiB/BaiF CoA transferase family protein n=1 Tax=Cupriavidus sp. DF5525 TaxID=3160989 RepID=UPI0003B05EF9|nr:CoA transferase [Ralstonia pickettii DTP0602]